MAANRKYRDHYYGQCFGTKIEHSHNHYLQPSVSNSLDEAITNFFNWTATKQGGSERLIVGLNDMSLPSGGLFDIEGDWGGPHYSHRLGEDVDIQNLVIRDTTVTVTHPITGVTQERTIEVVEEDWLENFKLLMEDKNWRFIDEDQTDPRRDPEDNNPSLRFLHFRWEGD